MEYDIYIYMTTKIVDLFTGVFTYVILHEDLAHGASLNSTATLRTRWEGFYCYFGILFTNVITILHKLFSLRQHQRGNATFQVGNDAFDQDAIELSKAQHDTHCCLCSPTVTLLGGPNSTEYKSGGIACP
jgi:hypothetical protein